MIIKWSAVKSLDYWRYADIHLTSVPRSTVLGTSVYAATPAGAPHSIMKNQPATRNIMSHVCSAIARRNGVGGGSWQEHGDSHELEYAHLVISFAWCMMHIMGLVIFRTKINRERYPIHIHSLRPILKERRKIPRAANFPPNQVRKLIEFNHDVPS